MDQIINKKFENLVTLIQNYFDFATKAHDLIFQQNITKLSEINEAISILKQIKKITNEIQNDIEIIKEIEFFIVNDGIILNFNKQLNNIKFNNIKLINKLIKKRNKITNSLSWEKSFLNSFQSVLNINPRIEKKFALQPIGASFSQDWENVINDFDNSFVTHYE